MLTQMMPALIDALRQALPPAAIGPLAQSLGNCAQPLTHRAGINLPGARRANQNGTVGSGAWNPSQYQNLFPGGDTYNSANYHTQVDIGGMNVNWNEGNRYDSQFYFPTNQVFQQNQYFGGPTINNTGGANIDYITNEYFDGDTINVTNLTTTVINGDPVAGPAGPPGAPGKDGQRGAPGAPGVGFGALPPGFFGPIRYLSGDPDVQFQTRLPMKKHRYIKDAWVRKEITVGVPTNAISGGTVTMTASSTNFTIPTNAISGGTLTFSPEPVQVVVPTALTFDPEACAVTVSATTTFWAFPYLPSYQTVNGQAASTQTVTVAATTAVTASLSSVAANAMTIYAATTAASQKASVQAAGGFVIKGADADFWERNPDTVEVSHITNKKLAGIKSVDITVYRK